MNRKKLRKQVIFALAGAGTVLALGITGAYLGSTAPRAAAQTVQTKQKAPPISPALPAAMSASAVVDAANAFLATLSNEQRTSVQLALTPQNAARWSNFPAAVVPRNGVYFRDLNPAQIAAALKVARLALSEDGLTRFNEIRATDDAFGKSDEARRGPGGSPGGGRGPGGNSGGPPRGGPPPGGGFGSPNGSGRPQGFGGPGGGGPPGGGQNLFGNGNYIIAFLGKPSKTTPWLLQLGGHHLAFNLYYKGEKGTATPYFVGAQPNIWKDAKGKTHAPLAPMRDAMYELVKSFNQEQLMKAHLKVNFNDVLVGPGQDGHYPAREGVPVSSLSAASQNRVKQAISAWSGDSTQAAQYRARYDAELNQTKVSYSGTTALKQGGDYVRIDGPHVWIEFACQSSDHYHTIWRDRTTDYGAEFSF